MSATKDLIVRVARDHNGHVFSEIWNRATPRTHDSVVIDRQNGRHLSAAVIISRAQSMSRLTGLPYEEDLSWPCVADKKLPCKCPQCIERGMA